MQHILKPGQRPGIETQTPVTLQPVKPRILRHFPGGVSMWDVDPAPGEEISQLVVVADSKQDENRH